MTGRVGNNVSAEPQRLFQAIRVKQHYLAELYPNEDDPALTPSNPYYVIQLYVDPTKFKTKKSRENIAEKIRRANPGRTVKIRLLHRSSLASFSISPFPQMEKLFEERHYVADIEGRSFVKGNVKQTIFVEHNISALQGNVFILSAALTDFGPQFFGWDYVEIAESSNLDYHRTPKAKVENALGPLVGRKTMSDFGLKKKDDNTGEATIYPVVAHEGLLLGSKTQGMMEHVHLAYESTPSSAINYGKRKEALCALFSCSWENVQKQIAFEFSRANTLFPSRLDKSPRFNDAKLASGALITWYSQVIIAMRKACWSAEVQQDSSVAAYYLRQEHKMHGAAIGSESISKKRRTHEQLFAHLKGELSERIETAFNLELAEDAFIHRLDLSEEVLAALHGSSYNSQCRFDEEPDFNDIMLTVSLARWIGLLKRKQRGTLSEWTANCILRYWFGEREANDYLIGQFPAPSWQILVDLARAVKAKTISPVHVTYVWTSSHTMRQPYACELVGSNLNLRGPLLCFPSDQTTYWEDKATIVRKLKGFIV